MKNILGRKQSIKNEDWLQALKDIESLVSKAELDELIEITIGEIKQRTAGKKTAYAWSGGKDSLVLGELCQMAEIEDCMLAVCDLEYPAFMAWVQKYKPEKLEIINTAQDVDWLIKHPEMLFPTDGKAAARWFSIVQHRAQAQYYKAHELDMLLLGRRRADEVTEKISEYGTLDEDEIRSIRESSEKREQKAAGSPLSSPPGNTINTLPEKTDQEPEEQKAENEPPTEVQRFVICPKCGEKIWL